MRQIFSSLASALAAALSLTLAGSGASAQEAGSLSVELNKLEASDSGTCQAFFLIRNDTGASLEAFELSLAILDSQGVIDQLLTVDAAPVPVARTTLKLFELPEVGCDAIGQILLHDIPACRPQNAEPMDCYPLLSLSSRANADLVK